MYYICFMSIILFSCVYLMCIVYQILYNTFCSYVIILYRSVIWRDNYGYMKHDSLYVLLEGKEQELDDVVNVLVLMIHKELLTNPLPYKKHAIVTRPQAIVMQKLQFMVDQAVYIMEDVIYRHKQAKLILMPIVLNDYYRMLVPDIPNQKYMHYSSLSPLYMMPTS